jgi:spoIIIJ-associated protein
VASICEGANIETVQRNGRIVYNVEGGDSALLIGKRGQTLEAIQYIIEKIVNRQNNTRVRVLVDVEGYLGARKTNLQKLAAKMAEKANRLGKPVTIGQMNAYDRRIVHLHLKDNAAVRTQSVGEGYYRKLVIFPKKRKRSKAKPE